MNKALITEEVNPASEGIDICPTEEALRIMNDEDAKIAVAVRVEIAQIAKAVDATVKAMAEGGRLFYVGAGTSGRLGVLDAIECPPTFNCAPGEIQAIIAGGVQAMVRPLETNEDDSEMGAADLSARDVTGRDVVVGISSSGGTPYVLGALKVARQLGALTIGISCNPRSELAEVVDISIAPITGPEVVAGSTRLKAGTATKLVLNMLSTVTMIRRGYVFRNMMVNVHPVNSKLVQRARKIVAHVVGTDEAQAATLLVAAGGAIKTAVLMGLLSLSRQEAEERLAQYSGRLRDALECTFKVK